MEPAIEYVDMPEDIRDRLFEPFVRGASGRGAGLGLSIVRAVVDAHGGSLTCVARPDGGLDITVRFPPRLTQVSAREVRSHPTALDP